MSVCPFYVSGLQPFVLGYAVQRNERQQDRCLASVCLVCRVGAVYQVLTKFQSAGSAEHHIDDSKIAQDCDDPLPEIAACSEADDE